MLNRNEILEKMKVHFPRWMDIRRKVSSSTGGLLLTSIADEVENINEAIEDYKKDFFINNYIGKEEEVITYLYRINVGIVKIENLILIEPDYKITETQKEFYNSTNVAYYEDGFLYFKEPIEEVTYAIDGYRSVLDTEKIHTWNIFDEFAVFVGIRRYQWESNKELVNRILAHSKNRINSSEDGLKNAIIANLINIDPDLSKEEILMERPTPENLKKYYNEFETILDHLNTINRDVYKDKKWDIDVWNFDLRSVDYIPHAWDIVLNEYANGVGFKDDLKVDIIDDSAKTDATLYFYKQKLEAINSYVMNNSIKENFKITLQKYKNDIKMENVKYKITASEAQKLDAENTFIEAHENKIGTFDVMLEDIVDPFLFGVDIEDKAIFDPNYKYNISYYPIDPYKEMGILYCKNKNGEEDATNLLRYNEPGFMKHNDGVVCLTTKKYIVDKYQFSKADNISKIIDGFVISNLADEANMEVNISACSNEPVYYDFTYQEVPVLLSDIKMVNSYISNGQIVADTVNDERYIEINIKANSFSAKIYGPYSIEYSVNNGRVTTKNDNYNKQFDFKIDGYNTPQDMKIKIFFEAEGDQCRVNHLFYSTFDLEFTTEKGNIEYSNKKLILPNFNENKLFIRMKSGNGFSPVLKYIYIGQPLSDNNAYRNIQYEPVEGDRLLTRFYNCRMQVEKIDKTSNQVVNTVRDYKPYKFYSTQNSTAQLELSIKEFEEIDSIVTEIGDVESISYGETLVQYLLKIPMDKSIYNLTISGTKNKLINRQSLSDIFSKKGYNIANNDIYIAKNIDKFILKNRQENTLKYDLIYKTDLFSDYDISSVLIIEAEGNNFKTKFIEIGQNNKDTVVIDNKTSSNFDYLTFTPTNSDIYVAINESNIIFPFTENIEVVNTFNNNFDKNKKNEMFYKVESLNEKFNVRFKAETKFELWDIYSLGLSTLGIKHKNIEDMKYNFELVTVEQELPLSSSIDLPLEFILPNKEKIDIRKYIIRSQLNVAYMNKYNDSKNAEDYVVSEVLYPDNTLFSKLKYSNVYEVEAVSYKKEDYVVSLVEGKDYKVHKTEGIILWLNEEIVTNGNPITINYNFNIPRSIIIDQSELYEKVKYVVDAYELIGKIKLEQVSKDQTVDLAIYNDYKESDLVTIKCDKPGFFTEMNNDAVTFKKNVARNTVAVQTGYYYMDGTEYYLFSSENFDNIEKIDDLYFNNVEKINKQFILKQQTTNYINNSSMMLTTSGEIFNLNCNDKQITGVSTLNTISACESFNYWNAPGASLSIAKGLNGLGVKYKCFDNVQGYIYLPLTTYLKDLGNYVVSFYLDNPNMKTFLGKERKITSMNSEFNKQSVIDIVREIKESKVEENIFETTFFNNGEDKYYLIAEGENIIDDILVVKEDKHTVGMHTKNISYLNIDIDENIYADYNTRMYLTDKYGSKFDGTEINQEGQIMNSAYIQWGFTKTKEFVTPEDFRNCQLENIDITQYNDKCVVKTLASSGVITTRPIYIGNARTIKNLLFKINDVMFDSMKGFKTTIYTSDNASTGFKQVSQHLDNIGAIDGESLSSYVKLVVEMPPYKVINSIELFTEYLSNDTARPSEMSVLSGSYVSRILDTQYTSNYKVKRLNISDLNRNLDNYIFQVRASKENNDETVWTPWKTIILKHNYRDEENDDIIKNGNIYNKIIFEGYRYLQFKVTIKGEDSAVKINYMDLEVI